MLQLQNMKNITLALLSMSVLIASCSKQPVANFTTDKDTYTAGESIVCSNTSEDAVVYDWEYLSASSGQTITEQIIGDHDSIKIETTNAYGDGEFEIKLTVTNEKRDNTDEVTKTVNIIAATGSVTFYTKTQTHVDEIEVTINGEIKTLTKQFEETADCNEDGAVYFEDLAVGVLQYSVYHKIIKVTKTYDILILKDNCQRIEVLY